MLYEPTNVTPSILTQTGTVAAADNVNIQWQVNGNSAMIMFQIDVYTDDANSTLVYSTGVITQTPTPSVTSQPYTPMPFYGKDNLGNYVTFNYYPPADWGEGGSNTFNWGLIDGESYKFVITQFYAASTKTFMLTLSSTLSANSSYYFTCTLNNVITYVSFATSSNLTFFSENCVIYVSLANQSGWIKEITNNYRIETNVTFGFSSTAPTEGTNLNAATLLASNNLFYNTYFTVQNAPSAIIARTAPTLSINSISTPVTASAQTFTASYQQAQEDSILSVQWQLYNQSNLLDPIDNTGEINTAILEYSYNGLFNNENYQLICSVTTQNNVTVSASLSFGVAYTQQSYTGSFEITPICRDNSNYLEWNAVMVIPGTANPENGYSITSGTLNLASDTTITWNSVYNEPNQQENLNISTPWNLVWSGTYPQTSTAYINDIKVSNQFLNQEVNAATFSPDGSLLVLGGNFSGYASVFSVSGTELTYIGNITKNGVDLSIFAYAATFSPDGSLLVLGGYFSGYASVFSVSGTTITYVGDITKNGTPLSGAVYTATFSSDGSSLVLGGNFSGYASVFSVSGTTITYVGDITKNGTPLNGAVYSSAIGEIDNYKYLILGGEFNGYASGFSVSGNTITYLGDITKNSIPLSGAVYSAAFYFNVYFAIGGNFSGYASIFSINGIGTSNIEFEYIQDFTKNNTPLDGRVNSIAVSSDSYSIVLGGYFSGCASLFATTIYSVYYISDITKSGTILSGGVLTAAFNSVENIVLGGTFSNYAAWWKYVIPPTHNLFSLPNLNIAVAYNNQTITVSVNNNIVETFKMYLASNYYPNHLIIKLEPSSIYLYMHYNEMFLGAQSASLSYTQQNLTNLQIDGPQSCDYIAVFLGDKISYLSGQLSDANFVPEWGSTNYNLALLANFVYGLDGGTGTSSSKGFYVFRRLANKSNSIAVAQLASNITQLKDYGIKSGESYVYDFYVYDSNGAFMGVVSNEETPVTQCFNKFSLLATEYNQADGCYHVVKEYQFSCNIQDMTISNNSNKTYVQNFTPYPTVFKSTANYASGTLQALIGFVDKEAYQYWDSTALMDELNGLSTSDYTMFLRDMKGHLWMVDVGTVQQTVTQKTLQMQVTISLPWTEIGSTEGVSIIQTPKDAGWNNGTEVLDVLLDVNVATGQLEVTYPYPYYGTTFSLDATGKLLIASTPIDVTPPTFTLSDVAQQPTDGQLSATVTQSATTSTTTQNQTLTQALTADKEE